MDSSIVTDGGNVNDELNKLFIPYRGYCARKGVCIYFNQTFQRMHYKTLVN